MIRKLVFLLFTPFLGKAQDAIMRTINNVNVVYNIDQLIFIDKNTPIIYGNARDQRYMGEQTFYGLNDRDSFVMYGPPLDKVYERFSTVYYTGIGGVFLTSFLLHQIAKPRNQLLVSLDTCKTFKKVVLPNDVGSFSVASVYNNRIYLEIRDLENSNKYWYVYSDDTLRTFVRMDEEMPLLPYANRDIIKFRGSWRANFEGHTGTDIPKHPDGKAAYIESNDRGKTWHKVELPVYFKPKMLSADTFYTMSPFKLWWSHDAGHTWDSADHNLPFFPKLGDLVFTTPDTGYAMVKSNLLYKTYNGGRTWDLKYIFPTDIGLIKAFDSKLIYFHSIGGSTAYEMDLGIYRTRTGAELPDDIEEVLPAGGFTLYPNPTGGLVYLTTPGGLPAEVWVHDLAGKCVLHRPAQGPGPLW
ncbi:MAG: hypothetical protein HYZ16_12595, partial [Bacteroidetes bacterium]|nr:hypothetical protein [Bacteroidota bacterium]